MSSGRHGSRARPNLRSAVKTCQGSSEVGRGSQRKGSLSASSLSLLTPSISHEKRCTVSVIIHRSISSSAGGSAAGAAVPEPRGAATCHHDQIEFNANMKESAQDVNDVVARSTELLSAPGIPAETILASTALPVSGCVDAPQP